MNTGRLRLGMLSILLTIIVICMSVLSLLSFATSSADLRLAKRYARTVEIRYQLEEEGRRLLMESGEDAIIDTEIYKDGYKLVIKADGGNITTWSIEKVWEEDTSIDDLWEGN
ncbi:MAG: hypothetical protein IJI46_09980 [Erysipelotrichaceae bacterium]|nr:hypothetical protein [Erysipelotrichaceae bacterium]